MHLLLSNYLSAVFGIDQMEEFGAKDTNRRMMGLGRSCS